MSSVYLASEAERTSHKEHMFAFMHLAHNKGWRPVGDMIIIYTNPFSAQQEQESIILPSDRIWETMRLQWTAEMERDALGIISNKGYKIKIKNTIPLINNLEI